MPRRCCCLLRLLLGDCHLASAASQAACCSGGSWPPPGPPRNPPPTARWPKALRFCLMASGLTGLPSGAACPEDPCRDSEASWAPCRGPTGVSGSGRMISAAKLVGAPVERGPPGRRAGRDPLEGQAITWPRNTRRSGPVAGELRDELGQATLRRPVSMAANSRATVSRAAGSPHRHSSRAPTAGTPRPAAGRHSQRRSPASARAGPAMGSDGRRGRWPGGRGIGGPR